MRRYGSVWIHAVPRLNIQVISNGQSIKARRAARGAAHGGVPGRKAAVGNVARVASRTIANHIVWEVSHV